MLMGTACNRGIFVLSTEISYIIVRKVFNKGIHDSLCKKATHFTMENVFDVSFKLTCMLRAHNAVVFDISYYNYVTDLCACDTNNYTGQTAQVEEVIMLPCKHQKH